MNNIAVYSYDIYMGIVDELNLIADYIIIEILRNDGNYQFAAQNLAKALVNLKGILKLCSTNNFSKGWVLSKALWVDFMRLRMTDSDFNVAHIADNKNETDIRKIEDSKKNQAQTQFSNERYDSFKREKLMEDVSRTRQFGKELNLDFIYAHGYAKESSLGSDYFNKSWNEIDNTIKIIDESTYKNERELLGEACILTCLIINETMNNSSLEWKWILFDYLKSCNDFLEGKTEKISLDFETIKTQCDKNASKRDLEV